MAIRQAIGHGLGVGAKVLEVIDDLAATKTSQQMGLVIVETC